MYDIPIFDANFYLIKKFGFYPKNVKIKIAKGGQGLKVVETKHKVIWNYINPQKFFYVGDNDNVLPRFQQFCIGSNNKNEILYLFAILNHPITFFLFEKYLRNENEKDILVGVKFIKEFIRVPKITDFNKNIKEEIILNVKNLLDIEKGILKDYVNFDSVLLQKFDKIEVLKESLVIHYKKQSAKCPILSNTTLIKSNIEDIERLITFDENNVGFISELKKLPLLDKTIQKQIKNYIDDLVYSLYFKIKIPNIGFNYGSEINQRCSQNKFYDLIKRTDG